MARSLCTLRRCIRRTEGPRAILLALPFVLMCLAWRAYASRGEAQNSGSAAQREWDMPQSGWKGLLFARLELGESGRLGEAGRRSATASTGGQLAGQDVSGTARRLASAAELQRLAGELSGLRQSARSEDGLAARLARAREETERVLRKLAELRLRMERIEVKLAYLEANRALGVELRHDLARLPEVNEYRRRLRDRQRELAELHGLWLDLAERRDSLADADASVRRVLTGLPGTADRRSAAREARELVAALRAEYAAQAELAQQLFSQLLVLEEAEAALVQTTLDLARLIEEHVLWVPSLSPMGLGDWEQIRRCVAWLASASRWHQIAAALRADATEHWFLYGLVLVGGLWWFWSLGGWRSKIHQIGSEVLASYAAEFRPTARAGLLTAALAVVTPSLLAFLAWRMRSAASEFTSSLGRGLWLAAMVLLAADLCRQVCRRRGLAEAHFLWPSQSVAVLRRQLRWAIPLAVPLVVAVAALEGVGPAAVEPHRSVLGRLLFIGLMCVVALFFWRLFEPRRGVLAAVVDAGGRPWLATIRPYAALVTAAAALLLAGVSASGYHFTALKLAWRLQATVWLVLSLVLVHAMLQRWLLVLRRKVAIEQARAEREAAQAALRSQQPAPTSPVTAASGVAELPASGMSPASAAESANFAEASAQSKRLLHGVLTMAGLVGLWWVWVDVLPALRYLDRWQLWPNPAYQAEGAESAPAQGAVGGQAPGRLRYMPYVGLLGQPAAESKAAASGSAESLQPQGGSTHGADAGRDAHSEATTPQGAGGAHQGPADEPRAETAGGGSPAADAPAANLTRRQEMEPPRPVALREGPQKDRWITAGDLLAAAAVLLVTWMAVRNLPGLLEIALWQRLPLDRGVRYAMSTLTRYAIVLCGVMLGLSTVGIRWQNVQWLVAAMTVGLAFGLQEIFANFVSGLILLFERPIRPGDVVTVGSISGVVNCIRIRSTTITDWDRKELIVPNKEFITGQVVNWTLSDPTQRLVLRVGVAYGTDPNRAAELLASVARSDPRVLREPPPSVVFMGFGESSLDFDVRVFLPGPEQIMQVRHDLNVAINAALREAGIEIPFPQRVVHLRGEPPRKTPEHSESHASRPAPETGP